MRLGNLLLFLFPLSIFAFSHKDPNDPYMILGLRRGASARDIKQAYKQAVREWHPDKNDSPDASEKFMSIKQAYELLSDPSRKERYDRYGAYDSEPQQRQANEFDDIFNFAFGEFNSQRSSNNVFDKHRISYRMYTSSILEKSQYQPFIIYAYSSYCHVCFLLESIWKDATNDLESLGYGIGTVNYLTDGNLFEKLRISHIPAIVVVVEGRVIHYRGNMNGLNAKALRMFARDSILNTFMQNLNTYSSLRRFIDQWESTNKPSVLILGVREEPKLRYLLLAMKYSHFARFAYVNINNPHAEIRELRNALKIQCSNCDNIFVFKENPEHGPISKLVANDRQFTIEEMNGLLDKHKLLRLPRLSSMPIFDEFCPVSSRSLKHLCVILPVYNNAEDKKFVNALLKFVDTNGEQLTKDRIHIAYIFVDRQRDFMGAMKSDNVYNDEKKSVLVFWRYEYVKAKYTWLLNIWSADQELMYGSFDALKKQLYLLSRGTMQMDSTAKINNLYDEYALSWFTRLSRQMVRMAEMTWFHITKEEALPLLSIAGTLFFIFFVGYGLNYLVAENNGSAKNCHFTDEKNSKFHATENRDWHPEDPKTSADPKQNTATKSSGLKPRYWREMEPMIHELRAETYFGLIRLLKPGCRSIIILVDSDSKDILLQKFARHIYSLRNNKTFSFGYLMVNKNLSFFRSLLEFTLPSDSESNTTFSTTLSGSNENVNKSVVKSQLKEINPKQTLGTVLVLCGWKLYFSIYHPMHNTKRVKNSCGFDCSSDDDTTSSSESNDDVKKIRSQKETMLKKDVSVENVLNGFSSFLDRMLEGSVRRYYIPEWPDNLK